MAEIILFNKSLSNLLLNNYKNDKDSIEKTYLTVSVDFTNIYWIIKINNNNLSEDFLNLLKFILPFGVRISGILYLGEIELNTFSNRVFSSYNLLKNFGKQYDLDFVFSTYYSFIVTFNKDTNLLEISAKLFKFDEIKFEFDRDVNLIKFLDLSEKISKEFLLINCDLNPLLIINKEKVIMNELFNKSNICLYYPELNILIPCIERDMEMEDNLLEMYGKKMEGFLNLVKILF